MKAQAVVFAGVVAWLGVVAVAPAQAQQSRLKECAQEWNAMKAANQTDGKTWRELRKECLARGKAAAPGPAGEAPAVPPGTRRAQAGGRQAMVARERACAADWKAAKAGGQVAAGTTWPSYWSDCNKRKKAEGM